MVIPNAYRFESLVGPHDIRILQLAPGQANDQLSGCLRHVSLPCGLAYEALSYEWGCPERKHTILLENNFTAYITQSLHQALRDIRHQTRRSKLLWADGICINQDDLKERQRQVAIMGMIYRRSARVITYIGPERDGSSAAIEFARSLVASSSPRRYDRDQQLFSPAGFANIGLPPEDDMCWNALKDLLLRGWVSAYTHLRHTHHRRYQSAGTNVSHFVQAGRCWCAQEFLLNDRLTMMCGPHEISDWDLIPKIVQLTFRRSLPSFILPSATEDPNSLRECLWAMMQLRQHIERGGLLSLHGILCFLHPLRATDPRDKVYSVVGLALDHERTSLSIDYDCSTEQLYISVAKILITQGAGLDILYSNLHRKSLNLPSWVPDWSSWQFGSNGAACRAGYAASGKTRQVVRVRSPENVLEISGRLIDRVTWLSSHIGSHYSDTQRPDVIMQRRQWLEEQQEVIRQLEPYPGGGDIANVLWRTLIGNITFTEDPAEEDYNAFFDAHFNLSQDSTAAEKEMAREFCDAARRRSRYRRLAVTESGYFAAVPQTADIGDWLCVFHGLPHLFLIRTVGNGFTYLGHVYGHGLMDGEALLLEQCKEQTIALL